jgi:hypothetical protein
MKTLKSILSVITVTLLVGCYTAHCAPGEVFQTNDTIHLVWDANPPGDAITHYTLYMRTSFPPDMPTIVVPPGTANPFHPVYDTNWVAIMTVTNRGPGGEEIFGTNAYVLKTNKSMFFAVTASNDEQESLFSNVAWKSAVPSATNQLRALPE